MKVIKAANLILDTATHVSPAVVRRTVPSIVLLSAIHYRGIEDPPSFDFIKRFPVPSESQATEGDASSKDSRQRMEKWSELLRALNFSGADEFEILVKKFLDSGMYGDADLERILGKYVANDIRATAITAADELKFQIGWDAATTELELIGKARKYLDQVQYLGPSQMNSLYESVSSLSAGADVAEALIERWVNSIHNRSETNETGLEVFYASVKGYHHRIAEACFRARRAKQSSLTIRDSIERIVRTGKWGAEQDYLNSRTVVEFENELSCLSPNDLRLVCGKMFDISLHRANYSGFSTAIDTFLRAAKQLEAGAKNERLSKIVGKRLELFQVRGGKLPVD